MRLRQFCLYVTLVWITRLGAQCSTDKTATNKCTSDQYYSDVKSQCLPCSSCSGNDLVRKPCTPTSDTVCGPFKEFDFFHQHTVTNNTSKDPHNDAKLQSKKTELHLTIYSEGHSNIAVAESKESQHWRKVAFALIGALSGLIFLATLVVLVICRRMNVSHPPRPAHTDDEDGDCPYVVIHTIRPSDDDVTYQVPPGPNALHQLTRQRHRLYKYHPKRRLLQANEYADDVFESEDSAGSRRRISLQVIPETGNSDNEGDMSPKSETFPAGSESSLSKGQSTLPKDQSTNLENSPKSDDPVCGNNSCLSDSEHHSKSDEAVCGDNSCTSDSDDVLNESASPTKEPSSVSGDTAVSSIQHSEDTCTLSSSNLSHPSCECSYENMICSSSIHPPKCIPSVSSADVIPSSASHPSKHATSTPPVLSSKGIPSTPAPSSDLESDELLTSASEQAEDHGRVSTSLHLNHRQTPPPKKSPPSSPPRVVSPLLSVSGSRVTSSTLPVACDEEDISALMETSSLLRSQIHVPWVSTSGSG